MDGPILLCVRISSSGFLHSSGNMCGNNCAVLLLSTLWRELPLVVALVFYSWIQSNLGILVTRWCISNSLKQTALQHTCCILVTWVLHASVYFLQLDMLGFIALWLSIKLSLDQSRLISGLLFTWKTSKHLWQILRICVTLLSPQPNVKKETNFCKTCIQSIISNNFNNHSNNFGFRF